MAKSIPVYIFTGFLDAGKTKFIQGTLEDPRFHEGERTLLLVMEEGEEEYDLGKVQNVFEEIISVEQLDVEYLEQLQKKYRAQRVMLEFHGMETLDKFYNVIPENWDVVQEVMFADATTILAYNANMRNLVVDKLMGAQMVVFNRVQPGMDTMPLHKLVRGVNRNTDILYEDVNGISNYDDYVDPLPFDINAPVVKIEDEDFGLFYRDISEEPDKYKGKTVYFKAQVAKLRKERDGVFAPGRFVMTCCVEDIQFCGIPCYFEEANSLHQRDWVYVTAKADCKKHSLYHGEVGPVLYAEKVTPAPAADRDYVTF